MGLMVHSLEGMPEEHSRDYFIYLLDYGWDEPLSNALRANFNRMATLASEKGNAVVVMRTDAGIHFDDEVLSWHSINGDDAQKDQLLPAILVTNKHPAEFRKRAMNTMDSVSEKKLKLILFPLRKHCKDTTQVVELIQNIFSKIKQGLDLDDFGIVKQKKQGRDGASANALILEPGETGIGFSFNELLKFFKPD